MLTATDNAFSARAACLKLETTPYRLMKFASIGLIRVVAERGQSIRYLASDVERLLAERQAQATS